MSHSRTRLNKCIAVTGSVSLVLSTSSAAIAQNIDFTTLSHYHFNSLGQYVIGISPYYTQDATANSLQIIGDPYVPNNLGTHNPTAFPIVTGDFSAVITAKAGPNAGGSFDADFSGGYAGSNFNANQVWAGYGVGFGNVNTSFTDYNSTNVTFDLTRTGDTFNVYASAGGAYINLLTLVGSSISGGAGFDVVGWGGPGVATPETTTYSNFYITGAANGNIVGGTATNPTLLPANTTTSVTGDIGGAGEPTSAFYTFYWKGGVFDASAGVPEAGGLLSPPSYKFDLCAGTTCVSPLEETIADVSNSWVTTLSANLAAGFYSVGITDLGPFQDPQYTITFDTPISQIASVPEPSTWAMTVMGFAGLGWLARQRRRKLTAA
jgi:hypothetical protein